MTKGVYILNEMPEDCEHCPLCGRGSVNGVCIATQYNGIQMIIPLARKRLAECPLRPLPEKKELTEIDVSEYFWGMTNLLEKTIHRAGELGYNECIDDILGVENE